MREENIAPAGMFDLIRRGIRGGPGPHAPHESDCGCGPTAGLIYFLPSFTSKKIISSGLPWVSTHSSHDPPKSKVALALLKHFLYALPNLAKVCEHLHPKDQGKYSFAVQCT